MALGIDIYRYQTVTDPHAVARAGVAWAYVKATDGGGKAIVPADHQVRQMKQAGIPVGLYHYAQFNPSAEAQARLLHSEVQRLGADDLPPALDLEDPFPTNLSSKKFALDFLRELKLFGYDRVTLYGNTSMLTAIQAATIREQIPGLLVWEANYGPNNGTRRVLPNRAWRTDIHQYTSVGSVSGISGRVDLNESFTDPTGEEDMALTQDQINKIAETVWMYQVQALKADGSDNGRFPAQDLLTRTNQAAWIAAGEDAVAVDPKALAAELIAAGLQGGGATAEQIEEIINRVGFRVGPKEEA